jgi:hypothetical protein
MADDTLQHEPTTTTAPVTVQTAPQFTDSEIAALRQRLNQDPDGQGANRFVWFLIGCAAALLSIVVAAVVFLAVSDEDDDGNIDLDVPSVEVDG